jgi:thiosulfate reductase cytochrome b subunit
MTLDQRDMAVEPRKGGSLIRRHRLSTRIWHWTNAVTTFVMLMSGLMIFNAHPRLYWGAYGANFDRAWLTIGSTGTEGFVQVGDVRIPSTGVLGRWRDSDGDVQRRAFPGWATIPSTYSLSSARRWHLSFAWVLAASLIVYLILSFANRHVQRDLAPDRRQLRPAHILQDIVDHARLRFPTGEAAAHYNVLQKVAYLGVLFVLLPLLVLTGLAMSPGLDAAWPWLSVVTGGRQSARSIHFICAALIALFIVIHLLMVVLAGPINEIRSMITGRYRLPPDREEAA